MTGQSIEVEAESLEEAKAQARSQIPEGFYLLSEQVIADGQPSTVKVSADTTEAAFAKSQDHIPDNADILDKKVLSSPERKVVPIEAFDEETARQIITWKTQWQAGITIVKSIRLTNTGQKGFFGMGKKPHQYEAEVLQQATVEVTYKTKAKVSIRIGKKIKMLVNDLQKRNDYVDRLNAAATLGWMREFEGVDVFPPLIEAAKDAISEWEATKMILSAAHNVSPDQIVLAPHADPSSVTLTVLTTLLQLTKHSDTSIGLKAQDALEEIQESIRENRLSRLIGFPKVGKYSDIGPIMGTCSTCGREVYAIPGVTSIMLVSSGQFDKIKASARWCLKCNRLYCLGCTFKAGGEGREEECPKCKWPRYIVDHYNRPWRK